MSKNFYRILACAIALVAAASLSACSASGGTASSGSTPSSQASAASAAPLPAGLVVQDETVGTGPAAAVGDRVSVHYTGWLTDGTKFDSSIDRNTPLQFTLGNGEVIEGWDKGVVGMKVGGKRKLTIPPELAYGSAGRGPIPPDATLVFEITLLKING